MFAAAVVLTSEQMKIVPCTAVLTCRVARHACPSMFSALTAHSNHTGTISGNLSITNGQTPWPRRSCSAHTSFSTLCKACSAVNIFSRCLGYIKIFEHEHLFDVQLNPPLRAGTRVVWRAHSKYLARILNIWPARLI